jgi:hypothetical protein
VAFFASVGTLSSSAYLICVSEASNDPQCSYSSASEPTAFEVGGTSVASPAMAGVMALINQKAGAAQGSPNAELYALAAQQSYSSCSSESIAAGTAPKTCFFNDIDIGTNAMACDAGAVNGNSPNCTNQGEVVGGYTDNVGVLAGYSAVSGYDQATGLGSLNVANVVNAWPATTVGTTAATVTVTPAQSTLNSGDWLSVTVAVASSSASATMPTGTVVLIASAGTGAPFYTQSGTLVGNGSYTFNIPAGTLGAGTDTLTGNFVGDAVYSPGSNTAQITVNSGSLLPSTVQVTPVTATLNSSASLNVTVTVSGSGATPTGTVTLSGGGYTSPAQWPTLTSGSYQFTIPAGVLAANATGESDTLTATYSGDSSYASSTNTATVTVTESTFSLSPTTPLAVNPGSRTSSVVTVTSVAGYVGTVSLTCQLITSPAGAVDAPSCSIEGTSAVVSLNPGSGNPTGTGFVGFFVSTTAPVAAALLRPHLPGRSQEWESAGGSALLAVLVFLGIPARRRSWRAMLGLLVLTVTLATLSACGGGVSNSGTGSGTGTGTQSDPGTTPGSYTFQVFGTGSPSVTPAVSTTFSVTVY